MTQESPEKATAVEIVAAPSAALVAAVERVRGYKGRPVSKSTERGYRGEWERFQTWARANGVSPLPAAPEVVCAYLEELAKGKYSAATIAHVLAAVTRHHRLAGFDFRRNAPIVAEVLDRIRRDVGVRQTKKAPLGLKALGEICRRLQAQERAGDVVALRNRALLLTGWFCMLRSANLVAIQRDHVRFVRFSEEEPIDDNEHPEGMIVHLPKSKTDQRKEGRDVAVHSQSDETLCPVRTLLTYLNASSFSVEDRIFPMSERTVARLVKRLMANPAHGHASLREIEECESCFAVVRRFASHSLRRGSATTLATKGAGEREIMRQGGWKSERVMRGYIEQATIFQDNPTKDLTADRNNGNHFSKSSGKSVRRTSNREPGVVSINGNGSPENTWWFLPKLILERLFPEELA